mgnify:FL=1
MLKKLCSLLLIIICFSAVAMAADKKFTLVIDAGHGGKDAGAVGAFSKEKNINLSVALAFGRYVEQYCPSVKVIYTRKKDVFIELNGRANIANRNKADLFISIHTNSVAGSRMVRGFETYTLGMHRASDNLDVAKRENSVITMESDYRSKYQGFDPNSAESYIMFEYMQDKNMENSVNLAKYIQSNVCRSASRVNKGVHQAGFLVLRETSMPSCLVELGFISTPDEERQLNDPIVQDQMARGLYQAFGQYLNKYGNGVKASTLAAAEDKPAARKVEETTAVAPAVADKPAAEKATVEQKTEKETDVKHETNTASVTDNTTQSDVPVFKVQILCISRQLKKGDPQFKGLNDIDSFKEGGLIKYTYGASTDYNEIAELRKSVLDKFPQAFVIAFKHGEKINVQAAIVEWRKNK